MTIELTTTADTPEHAELLKSQPSHGPATWPRQPPNRTDPGSYSICAAKVLGHRGHTPANGTASPQSDDIDATPGTEPRRSGTIRLAILKPWHLPDTTEYGEIEYW